MTSCFATSNRYAVLDPQSPADGNSIPATSVQQVPTEDTKPVKPTRIFTKHQIIVYQNRQIARAEKLAQATIDQEKAAKEKAKKLEERLPRVFTKEENDAFQARKAKRAIKAAQGVPGAVSLDSQTPAQGPPPARVYTAEETQAYNARRAHWAALKARRAEERAAYLERNARREARAAEKAAYEARVSCREERAAYEAREAKRQAKAKKIWEAECLRNRACFNCGSIDHRSKDCGEPPYQGKY